MTVTDLGRAAVESLATDRSSPAVPRTHRRTRRWITAGFLVVGACLLGISLSVDPGSTAFYPLTIGLGAVWVIGAFASGPLPIGRFGITADDENVTGAAILGVVTGVAVGLVFTVGALITQFIPGVPGLVSQILDFADYGSLVAVWLITLGNGLAEELFFRGALYSALVGHRPVLVSTIIYVIVTLASGNPMLGFAAVILGTVCAILRRCTGGVLAPVLTHVVWSAIILITLPLIFG